EEAVTAFKECVAQPGARASALHNLAYALERLGRYDEAQSTLAEAVRRGGAKDPRIQTSVGVVALRTGDVVGADQALQIARPLFGTRPPTAAWFAYAGLTAALRRALDRAAALPQEAIAAHRH